MENVLLRIVRRRNLARWVFFDRTRTQAAIAWTAHCPHHRPRFEPKTGQDRGAAHADDENPTLVKAGSDPVETEVLREAESDPKRPAPPNAAGNDSGVS